MFDDDEALHKPDLTIRRVKNALLSLDIAQMRNYLLSAIAIRLMIQLFEFFQHEKQLLRSIRNMEVGYERKLRFFGRY